MTTRRQETEELTHEDALSAYLAAIRRYPVLAPAEEKRLAKRFRARNDPQAARKLLLCNLRLVVKIANQYGRAHGNRLDLIQEGNIGLVQAIRKFDPERAVKLSTYGAWWIRAYMLKFILNNWRLVRVGTTHAQRRIIHGLRAERARLERLGFEPEYDELARRLDVSELELREVEQHLRQAELSLDAPLGDEEDGTCHLDMLSSEDGGRPAGRPDEEMENQELRDLVRRKLGEFGARLGQRDRALIRERWLAEEPSTLESIGRQFGISRERARQIEQRLLDRFRRFVIPSLGGRAEAAAA